MKNLGNQSRTRALQLTRASQAFGSFAFWSALARATEGRRSWGDFEIEVSIEDGVVTGKFPKRALRHVLEWYDLSAGLAFLMEKRPRAYEELQGGSRRERPSTRS
jgi:hypothetical protein